MEPLTSLSSGPQKQILSAGTPIGFGLRLGSVVLSARSKVNVIYSMPALARDLLDAQEGASAGGAAMEDWSVFV
jgi:hypothetical protein